MPSTLPRRARALLLLAAVLLVGGCAGLQAPLDAVEIAARHLPPVRVIPHPDTLRHVTVQRNEAGLSITLNTTRGAVHKDWSAGYQNLQGRTFFSAGRYQTYATLRSREMSIVELDASLGLSSLTPDLVDEQLTRHLEQTYRPTVAFDVMVFVSAEFPDALSYTNLRTLSPRVALRIDDARRYRATRIVAPTAPSLARRSADAGSYYRINTVYFDRFADGRDILEGASRLELSIRTARPQSSHLLFTWEVREPEPPQAARPGQ